MSLKEDTVSADRKERIIFDPEAWRKSDKSGRKTSAITSRQNFDNEKFTRKNKDQVDEGTIQPSGDSKVESAGPTQSDTIADTKKVKKSNNPQIEFVTGTAQPNGSSSATNGSQQAAGRKISEGNMKKTFKQIVAEAQYAGLEKEDKPGKKKTEMAGTKNAVSGETVEGWKDAKKPVKENLTQEETNMSEKKTYAQFVEQLLEYTPGPGGVTRVQGRSYGAQYHDPEGDEDADDKPKATAPAVKRGRGRPAGSKSGANQKVTTGKSYGGIATHSLNLPNSNR